MHEQIRRAVIRTVMIQRSVLYMYPLISRMLSCEVLCLGADYYADAVDGNDGSSGPGPTAAWKTIAKVNASGFAPGVATYHEGITMELVDGFTIRWKAAATDYYCGANRIKNNLIWQRVDWYNGIRDDTAGDQGIARTVIDFNVFQPDARSDTLGTHAVVITDPNFTNTLGNGLMR